MRLSRQTAPLAALLVVSEAFAAPQGVLISEFRVRGPAGGNDEFVEIHNTGSAPVDVSGWQLRGCQSGTPGTESTRATVPAGVVLAPGAHYLFFNSSSSGGYSGSVAGDRGYGTGVTDFQSTNFAGVALRDAGGTYQDGVGAPNSPCREGLGLLTPTANPATQSSLRRAVDETQDAEDNALDFATADPADIDNFGTPPPPPPAAFRRIHEIQGAQHRSPLEGQTVRTRGIVTAVFDVGTGNKGFYVQDPDGDGLDATSEGLLVFTGSVLPGVTVAQEVSVTGTVTEFRPGGAGTQNLSTTELTSPSVVVESTTLFGAALAPTVIGAGGRVQPNRVVDDDTVGGDVESATGTLFDPAGDGVDFYESLEGMWVQINDGLVTGPTNGFGEVYVVPDGGAAATGLNARGGITLNQQAGAPDYNPERVQIDDDYFRAAAGNMPAANVGDRVATVQGVVAYNFGNFEVLPSSPVSFAGGGLQREVTQLASGGDRLTVANYNVENLDPADGAARFAAIAAQIAGNLGAPDIVALQEVQDNSGAVNDGTTASDQTLALLVDALRNTPTAGAGPQYTAFDIAPLDGTVGGEPGGNIRVAYLYKADRVRLVPGTQGAGDATSATGVTTDADGALALTRSPGYVDPLNPAFEGSRRPLAAMFEFNGHRVLTLNNHWSSKGGSSPILGRTQPFVNGSESARLAQAQVVRGFTDSVLAADANARLLVLGDLNEFTFNAPLRALTDAGANGEPGLIDLADTLIVDEAERYSYVFEGNAQSLDHMLASPALMEPSVAVAFDAVHINSEFADQLSDHDPDLASFLMPRPLPPLACAVQAGDHVIDRRESRGPQLITGKLSRRNVIFGSAQADFISGGSLGDCIDGGGGSDAIFGLGGDDLLIGGEGRDLLSGGAGTDRCEIAEGDVRSGCEE